MNNSRVRNVGEIKGKNELGESVIKSGRTQYLDRVSFDAFDIFYVVSLKINKCRDIYHNDIVHFDFFAKAKVDE